MDSFNFSRSLQPEKTLNFYAGQNFIKILSSNKGHLV